MNTMRNTKKTTTFDQFEQLFLSRAFDEAEEYLDVEQSSESVRNSFNWIYAKVRLLKKKGQYSENSQHFQNAIALITSSKQNISFSVYEKALLGIEMGQVLVFQKKSEKALVVLNENHDYFKLNSEFVALGIAKIALGNLYLDENDFNTANEYANDALQLISELAEEQDNLKLQVCNLIGRIFVKKQEYDQALKYSELARSLAVNTGNIEEELIALNNIAISNVTQSQYQAAMEIFFDVLDRSSSIDFRPMIARSLINIGSVYAQLFNFDEASKRYEEALDNYYDCLSSSTAVVLYNNIGNAAFSLLEYNKAIQSFQRCLNLAIETNYQEMIAHTYAQLSKTYIAKKQYGKASGFAIKAYHLMEDLPDIAGIQINLLNLGQIAFFNQEFDKAIRYASKGIVMAKAKYDDFSKIRGYQLLADIHHAKGNFEDAYRFLLIHKAVQQEFSQLQYARQVLNVEIKNVLIEKQHEIERLQTENDLQAKLLEQQDKLKKTNAQLIEVNGELRQFVYVASHDLKEPVRMIGSYAKIIDEKYSNALDEKGLEYLGFVKNGAVRMNDLIDGLLKYSLIGKDKPILKSVNMQDVLVICQSNLRLLIENNNAKIEIGEMPSIYGDFNLLVQLMQNLISNAIKFVKIDEPPVINISSEQTKKHCIIHISDNGIGINEFDQEEIFNIFKRLHSKNEYDGSGIGLAICQKIVQKMEGTIKVKSTEGKGTTFSIVFPLRS